MQAEQAADTLPVSRRSAPHYAWGAGCDGWHLLAGPALSVIEEVMPPGTAEQRHQHRRAQPFFYVLDGRAVLEVDGIEHVLETGHGLHVTAGQAHRMHNRGDAAVRFLVVSSPPSHGDRVAA